MAVRNDWVAGEVLTATDLNDTFTAKASAASPTFTGQLLAAAGSAAGPSFSFSGDPNTGVFRSTTDTLGFSAGGTSRMTLDSAGLIAGTGTSLGAWTSWTPTFSGTGWAIGNASTFCGYMKIGRLIAVRARIDTGSTTTYGSGRLDIGGAPSAKTGGYYMSALCFYNDSSLGQAYAGTIVVNGAAFEMYNNDHAARANIISTVPFTWASGDGIYLTALYEADTG